MMSSCRHPFGPFGIALLPLVGSLLVASIGIGAASSGDEIPSPLSDRTMAYQQRLLHDYERVQQDLESADYMTVDLRNRLIEIGRHAEQLHDMALSDVRAFARSEHTSQMCRDAAKGLTSERPDFESQIAVLRKLPAGSADAEHPLNKLEYQMSATALVTQGMISMMVGGMACLGGAKADAWKEVERTMEREGIGFHDLRDTAPADAGPHYPPAGEAGHDD